jgi:5-methylcytosine-specific restriction endonuclease McrA
LERLMKAAAGTRGRRTFTGGRCMRCGDWFLGQRGAGRHCSKTCRRRDKAAARRALEAGVKITPGRRHAVYERDNWTCRICGDPVNRDAQVPELDAPTVDHIVPLARGGAHAPENWQTAHFYCNSDKRDQLGFEFADEEVA